MANSCNPTPLEFFRFAFSTHRLRAFEKYRSTLQLVLERIKDQTAIEKLQKIQKDLSETTFQQDWEQWMQEKTAMSIRHSVRQTNLDLHEEISALATNQRKASGATQQNKPGDDMGEEDIDEVNEDGMSDEDDQEDVEDDVNEEHDIISNAVTSGLKKNIDDEDAAYGDDEVGEVNARSKKASSMPSSVSATSSGCITPPRQITPWYDDWERGMEDLAEPNERPVNVINFEEIIVTYKKWLLRDGRDVRSLFEEYRADVGKTDFIAQCHIMEIMETAPIRRGKFGDDEAAWLKVCAAIEAKWDTHRPSSSANQYLQSLMMASVEETRQALMVPYCSTPYNMKEHYDLNYIHMVVNKFVTFFEAPNNPLLDADNSEGFLQAHVFALLVDQLFFDLPAVQVVR